jgi:hypothetical protein
LNRVGVRYEECSFEMVAIGPIWPEQADFEAHKPVRDHMAALERAVADELRQRGYAVLGTHPRAGTPDQIVLQQIQALLDPKFPIVTEPNEVL